MKKIIFIFLLVSISSSELFSQDTLKVGPIVSCFVDEWEKNKNTVRLELTNSGEMTLIKFKSSVFNNNGIEVISTDSIETDTLFPGLNVFYFEDLMPISSAYVSDEFSYSFFEDNKLPQDTYYFKVKILDTSYNLNQSYNEFEKSFFVSGIIASANLVPSDNKKICLSNLDEVVFSWTSVNVINTDILYNFQVKELFIDQTEGEAVLENPSIISINLLNSTQITLPEYAQELLLPDKEYIWYVTSYKLNEGVPTIRVGSNDGESMPFVFKTTTSQSECQVNTLSLCDPFDGFETGLSSLDLWNCYTASNFLPVIPNNNLLSSRDPDGLYNIIKSGQILNRHTIVETFRYDQEYSNLLVGPPGGGSFALQLGNSSKGGQAEIVTRKFTVTSQNAIIKLWYALVFQDPSHNPVNQPYFRIRVIKNEPTGRNYRWHRYFYDKKVANKFDPYYTIVPTDNVTELIIKDWDCYTIDLTRYIGQTILLELTTADCAEGGHFGYAYVDFCNFSTPTPAFTIDNVVCRDNGQIIADGSASTGESAYSWTIAELDNNNNIINSTLESKNVEAAQVATFDIRNFYEVERGRSFKCNKNYKVILSVKRQCSDWVSTEKVIFLSCPGLNLAGSDICLSGTGTRSAQIGSLDQEDKTYNWTPSTFLSSSTTSNPTITIPNTYTGTAPLIYTLTVTDANGCSSTDEVTVFLGPPVINNVYTDPNNCYTIIGASGTGFTSYQWIDLRTGNTIGNTPIINISPTYQTNRYRFIGSNICGSVTYDVEVDPHDYLRGDFSTLTYTNIVSDTLVITEWGKSIGVPAYNAYEYKLYLLNRWGGYDLVASGNNFPNSLNNGDIRWDLKWQGQRVQNDVYTLRLVLTNCEKENSIPTSFRFRKIVCSSGNTKKTFWGGRKCIGGYWHWGYEDVYETVITINVQW